MNTLCCPRTGFTTAEDFLMLLLNMANRLIDAMGRRFWASRLQRLRHWHQRDPYLTAHRRGPKVGSDS